MLRYRLTFAGLAAVTLMTGALLRADSIYLYNPDGSPALKPFRDNVTILKNKDRAFVFRTGSGLEQEIEFDKVARITVTADPALTEADDAYILQNFDKAVDSYLKAMRTNDAWKIQWITPRLSNAAAKTNRFDAALTAFLGYAKIDPPSAIGSKPTLPAKGSKYLDDAAKQIEAATRTATSDGERQALTSLLLDIQMQRGDQSAAELVANELSKLSGDLADPRIAGMIVGIRLDQANSEISAGRFDKVAVLLEPVRGKITVPAQQARAMFLLARAARATAGEDKTKLTDAAISFMRIPAHFGTLEGKPFVGEAMIEAAKINQLIGDSESAKAIYQQLQSEFANTALAQQAAQSLSELK